MSEHKGTGKGESPKGQAKPISAELARASKRWLSLPPWARFYVVKRNV